MLLILRICMCCMIKIEPYFSLNILDITVQVGVRHFLPYFLLGFFTKCKYKISFFCYGVVFEIYVGLENPVIRGGLEMQNSDIRCNYLTHKAKTPYASMIWPSGLGNYIICKRFAFQTVHWNLLSKVNLEQDTITD